VWLPGERWVDFARRRLHFELLLCLADAGGSATKEELVLRVWKETEYHPLRHDARLQVAIRKVRELIEEDPSRPERLVTTPEGYALRGTVRRIAGASEAS
jgi:DNA-binding winged helix-turn-helix (wHTH) protein